MPTVRLTTGVEFHCDSNSSILQAAINSKIAFPYSCKTGRCNSCKCKVIQGVSVAQQEEIGITTDEKNDGWILSCVRTPISDLLLDANCLNSISLQQPTTIPCKIKSIERMAQDVIRVFLRLPPMANFKFLPGQYVDIIGPGSLRRSYSIANFCCHDNILEIHIRAVDGGKMSHYWFDQAKINDLLRMHGPLGTFFLRNIAGLDLVFLATGTGIAPVKAMLESISQLPIEQLPRSTTIFWGGRMPQDLYFDITDIPGKFQFIPVLSRADSEWTGIRGYVQQALLDTISIHKNMAIYACGSNDMINSAKAILTKAGLIESNFYSDAFVCSATN